LTSFRQYEDYTSSKKPDENDCQSQLRAELDAYHTRLCGLTSAELRYTPLGVDSKEVKDEDFCDEPFRVLKEKESKLLGTCWMISSFFGSRSARG